MLACLADDRSSMCRASAIVYLFLSVFFSVLYTTSTACSNGIASSQVLEACAAATDCGPGLYCGNCPALGKTQPFCTRGQATIPTAIINGLPFNKYSWVVTHNSFSIVDAPALPGVQRLTFYNQEDTVTNQLRNGVRGLMLDMYDFNNDIWLCHSFRGQCFNFTAFQPAINTLKEVEAFLSENPSEIVTIIIEDYVHTPKGLTNLFTNAGLDKYWFPVSKMPRVWNIVWWKELIVCKRGGKTFVLRIAGALDWIVKRVETCGFPNYYIKVSNRIRNCDYIPAYQWKYMVENEAGDPGVVRGSCPKRKESKPLNSRSASLFLQNYFPTYPVQAEACKEHSTPLAEMSLLPVQAEACKEHSTPLAEMVTTCYKAAGNFMPNFLAVNFYMRSDGGGVFDATDRMNGQTLCGCSTVTACQAGAPVGSCKNVAAPSTSPVTTTAGGFTGSVQFSRSPSTVHSPSGFIVFLFYFLSLAFLF
ncbi:hypothetical protein CJ030_MR5G004899 [Morella rubra]|uniref:PI-PLC X domain-containing protein n=1 Tax=Morella rubra TaxID=262757 RepID=A0A6A1VT69_9ROSI|nr:hypothetical protein CJ030_MR5G004899 [Morella rubra]